MRRAFAILLTMLLSLPLILPAFATGGESKLPACCRKNGKHGCGMANIASAAGNLDQPSISSVKAKCPFYLSSQSSPAGNAVLDPHSRSLIFAEAVSHPAVHAQTDARYRVSFTRGWQKRGPPSRLS